MSTPGAVSCRTAEERERLILDHLRQVRWIAANVHERLPETVLQEDLISAGIVGLIAAVDNYDSSRNASLRTYAEHKIRGAILDSVRALDHIPVHRRRRAKCVQSALEEAERNSEGLPPEEDVARKLGMTVAEYREALRDLQGTTEALEMDSRLDKGVGPLRYIADRTELSPGCIVEREELKRCWCRRLLSCRKWNAPSSVCTLWKSYRCGDRTGAATPHLSSVAVEAPGGTAAAVVYD
jgi:RNA polymerase sigma factor for flagellar operon FliA